MNMVAKCKKSSDQVWLFNLDSDSQIRNVRSLDKLKTDNASASKTKSMDD